MRWLDGMTESMDRNLGKPGELVTERGLVCCSPRGCKESSVPWQLDNNNDNKMNMGTGLPDFRIPFDYCVV